MNHGHSGPIHIGYVTKWEKDLIPLLDICEQVGFPLNKDHNSGNAIRMSVIINSAHGALQSTAANTLVSPPDNLTILTKGCGAVISP
jgi:hypothetical protein